MHLNLFGQSALNKNPTKSKTKSHKKSYKKRSEKGYEKCSNILSSKGHQIEDYSSPYKLKTKSKDFLNQVAISGKEYSSYLKSKHIGNIVGNYSVESSGTKKKHKAVINPSGFGAHIQFIKPTVSKKIPSSNKQTNSQRKKKARSKTKTEKSVVFMMPGQHIGNQFIHYCK